MFERFSTTARAAVLRAKEEAEALGHHYIGTEHLLLGLLDPGAGPAYEVLRASGVDANGVRAAVVRVVGGRSRELGEEDAAALRTIGIDLDAVLAHVHESVGTTPAQEPGRSGRRGRSPFTRRAKKVLELGLREAVRLGDRHVGSEHVLLGLIREGEGLAAKILTDAGVDLGELRRRTLSARGEAA